MIVQIKFFYFILQTIIVCVPLNGPHTFSILDCSHHFNKGSKSSGIREALWVNSRAISFRIRWSATCSIDLRLTQNTCCFRSSLGHSRYVCCISNLLSFKNFLGRELVGIGSNRMKTRESCWASIALCWAKKSS